MSMKFLNPEEASIVLELASKPYRPKEIIDLKDEIKSEIRAAELNVTITGVIDLVCVQKIVEMKLCLWMACIMTGFKVKYRKG